MKKWVITTVLCSSLVLSGCVISVDGNGDYKHSSSWQDSERKNRKHIAKLQPNTSYEQILSSMGTADFNEFYKTNEDSYRVLYYRTQKVESDGVTTKEECTPLIFKNGILVGWGDSAYKMINE
ncbi:DUF3192 domain-containing protein [Paraglaciecola sp. 2405UD69-4]|uniref:DUF3192 domain-containing protein n=1 Tax=Paraglaciecola sp. 2405UD69-4 TaxID=3391836 RepID=UPI0039C95C25